MKVMNEGRGAPPVNVEVYVKEGVVHKELVVAAVKKLVIDEYLTM